MPDKTEPKDLETVLARLREKWQELADLLTSQGESQDRVVEVEKILLRDASGQYRGKISANPDGSADLLLSDQAGNAWVRLGVNRDGEAFFELKDQKGESSFKVAVGAPCPGAGPGPAATPADGQNPAASQPLESPGASPQPSHACRGWRRTTGRIGLGPGACLPPIKTSPLAGMPMPPYVIAWRNWRVSIGRLKLVGRPYPGAVGGDPGHPGLCVLSTPSPGLGRRGPRGERTAERTSWCATQTATSGPRWGKPATKSGWTCGTLRAAAAPRWGWGPTGPPAWRFMTRTKRSGPN